MGDFPCRGCNEGGNCCRQESKNLHKVFETPASVVKVTRKLFILTLHMRIVPILPKDLPRQEHIFLAFFQTQPLVEEKLFSYLPQETQRLLAAFFKKEFKGEEGEIKTLWLPEGGIRHIILFGLGERKKWHVRKTHLVGRRMVSHARGRKLDTFATAVPGDAAGIFATNALMAHFEYNTYKEKPKEGWPEVKTIFLVTGKAELRALEANLKEGLIIGEEVNTARALINTPGSDMTPAKLAAAARGMALKNGIRIKILDEPAIRKLGMGGVLGVAKGSSEKPRFIILEYLRGPKTQEPLVLVGKGVTFDTGGLNLKPSEHIYEMHMDMSGGAAVIHGMAAIARLKMPLNVVGLIPAVENMPSGSSYRPGDLLKSLSGKTIEVLDTDAEGRIILADGLAYGLRYKPGLMADFATLTGAAHVALGNYCSALFVNREELRAPLEDIGRTSGDYVWNLPLWDEYLEEIKGTFGDIANIGKGDRYGGAIHGAKFLEQFVGNTAWAHLDIAPRMTSIDSEYLAKGATGVGVRYIVELAKQYPELELP